MKKDEITMRHVLHALVKECGEEEGKEVFEWYCKTYNVNVHNKAPQTVINEVFY